MSATPYIEALSKETGMDITLSASGAATLSLGGRNLLIQWIEATNSFIVYVEVGALGGWRNGEICRLLLASNFLLADTQGGALSYNDATGMVGLNFPIPIYGLDTGDFLKAVNNVILFSETWKTRLDAMNKEQEELTEKAQQAVLDGGVGEAAELAFSAAQFLRRLGGTPRSRAIRHAVCGVPSTVRLPTPGAMCALRRRSFSRKRCRGWTAQGSVTAFAWCALA